jgi:hypothetical protein
MYEFEIFYHAQNKYHKNEMFFVTSEILLFLEVTVF